MSRILIIGGSRGIGKEVLNFQLNKNKRCIVLSRTDLDINDDNLEHHLVDISSDSLPEINDIESLIKINSRNSINLISDFMINY